MKRMLMLVVATSCVLTLCPFGRSQNKPRKAAPAPANRPTEQATKRSGTASVAHHIY